MALAAASALPLWASIVLAVASPAVAALALIVGRQQQDKTLEEQRQQQARMLRHERRRDDLGEVRTVLDDAARALHEADHRRRDTIRDLDHPAKREALRRAGSALDELRQRIAIRFGREHVVTTTYGACAEALLEVFGATQLAGLSDVSKGQRDQQMRRAGEKFEQLWPAFIDAATAHTGVELTVRA